MTNKEYMIGLLSDDSFIDDGGASWESMVHYNIKCPYSVVDERCHCKDKEIISRDVCVNCKAEWLENEVDE